MSKLQTTEGGFRMLQEGAGQRQGQQVADLLELFIGPLAEWLDERLDRRLVRTFFLALARIHRRDAVGLGEAAVPTKTLRRRFFSLAGRLTRKARYLTLHLPQHWPGKASSAVLWHSCAPCHSLPDGADGV